MRIFQGVLFLVFGVGILLVVYKSLATGWLPCGPNGFKGQLRFHRNERPHAFWLLFVGYAVAGVALTVFAVRLLVGSAVPLPLQ